MTDRANGLNMKYKKTIENADAAADKKVRSHEFSKKNN